MLSLAAARLSTVTASLLVRCWWKVSCERPRTKTRQRVPEGTLHVHVDLGAVKELKACSATYRL
jgi:hypothetical protein